ncbi:MAG: hypothetical protein GXP55_11120 [Deltaproteobacteria bacterium]|nr:hypothetical protein [Deltaproteobacteria bacterium]
MRRRTLIPLALSCLALSACGGAGPYGHAHTYAPLGPEEARLEAVTPISFEEVKRDPQGFAGQTLSFFGVVRHVSTDAESHQTTLRVDFRVLQPRNLCSDERSNSCRVTVSERSGGEFSALVSLRPGDERGPNRLWIGSLVRIYGTPTGDLDEEGGPVMQVSYYRYWPRSQYVTTAASGRMRR